MEKFAANRGTVIFAGEIPSLVDALPSKRALRFANLAVRCAWDPDKLLALLEPFRELDRTDSSGVRSEELLYQLRSDGAERHLFVCHRNRQRPLSGQRLYHRGRWRVFSRNTQTGEMTEIYAYHENEKTVIPFDFAAHGHALLTLRQGRPMVKKLPQRERWADLAELGDPASVTLSEPNLLLLNQAEWRWNDEPWERREELLRINNAMRERCALPPREAHVAQPWIDSKPAETLGRVSLKFRIKSGVSIDSPELALEEGAQWAVLWNNKPVAMKKLGWWVDECIERFSLPRITPGEHELVLVRDYTRKTEIEWCYLLGDFGVQLLGRHAQLTSPVRTLAFGDWTHQGLPFYTGNVTYHHEFSVDAGHLCVNFVKFKAALLSAKFDGKEVHKVAFAPFKCDLGAVTAGTHTLDVMAFGNRHNAFGPLHNIDPTLVWMKPAAWRSMGENWAYEYQLRPMGILAAPRLQIHETDITDPSADPTLVPSGKTPLVRRKSTKRRK